VDKARLLMLYIIWKEGGIFEDDKKKLLEHAKLKGELRDAINNLPLIGVKLTRVRKPEKSSFLKKRRQKKNKDEETPYELSRYVPVIKKVMDVSHIHVDFGGCTDSSYARMIGTFDKYIGSQTICIHQTIRYGIF